MLPIFIPYSGRKCKPEIPAEGVVAGVHRLQRQNRAVEAREGKLIWEEDRTSALTLMADL